MNQHSVADSVNISRPEALILPGLKRDRVITGSFMSEIDIAKIVAQKYAKTIQPSDLGQHSQQVKEEFRNVYKVWSAFVKFIKSQVSGKQKIVDTTFFGHFYKNDNEPINSSNIELMISAEFFEAANLKNKKLPHFQNQIELIQQFKEEGRVIQLNPAALALVCGIHKNMIQKILTDFFSAFIELSRRTQQEVILDFKIGNLHLYKNGELMFESKSDTDNALSSPNRRNEPREDISVIDQASAILSAGGGRVMSIRSSYLENLSVRTPQSHISKVSNVGSHRSNSSNHKLAQSQNWMKYRMRQKYESAQREKQGSDAPAPIEDQLQKQHVPYPFLSAFIERRTGNRFSKRVKFDPSEANHEKFLQQIINQINSNKTNKNDINTQKREEDDEFLENLKQKMLLDQQLYQEDKRQKQLDFIQANEALRHQKYLKKKHEDFDKKTYRLTYFPFTHGDAVIHQRKAWKEMQQADLAQLAEKDSFSPIKRKPLNTLKPEELHTIFESSTANQSPLSATPLQMTQNYLSMSATPNGSYLRPNYPYRVKNNDQMARTMDGAWKRFEDQLKREENVKKMQADQFQLAVTRDQQAIESEQLRKQVIQDEMKRELEKQMQHKQIYRELEQRQSKKPERTSFGPEENALLYQVLERRNQEAKEMTKLDLLSLIQERAVKTEFISQLEKSLDQNMIEQTVQAFHKEQRERKALDHQRKVDLKNAWIEQALINEKVRNVDALFN